MSSISASVDTDVLVECFDDFLCQTKNLQFRLVLGVKAVLCIRADSSVHALHLQSGHDNYLRQFDLRVDKSSCNVREWKGFSRFLGLSPR